MVDYNAPLYQHPQETWDKAKCEKLAKYRHVDGYGTKQSRKGYLGSSASIPPAYGPIRYNGGCEREGQWYQGENRPLPKVHEDFEIVYILSWGWYLRKKAQAYANRNDR